NVENLTLTGTAAINGTGNALNNILRGNSAANVLAGGPGNDTYVVGAGDTVVENPGEGVDTVQSSVSWTLAANVESLTLTGTAAINGTGNALNNSLTGNTAANVLDGGPGNDTLIGGRGNDTYVFNAGWGQDTISENDSTAGSTDTMLFGAAVRPLDLVLSRAANNLAVTLHGGTDRATVQNWYSGSAYQTEVIVASDGSRLLSSQVDLLIQAMANFSASAGLTWDQAIEQRPDEVQAILASYWQPPSY
ncbi:MAG TPA: calcium-binding protein, partial [Methylomirabilota bacterium]|nr:calcium-binding protein [Methylomirabilota bacterium]